MWACFVHVSAVYGFFPVLEKGIKMYMCSIDFYFIQIETISAHREYYLGDILNKEL